MAKPVFQVLMNLLVLDRASSARGKDFRCSQSALCTTSVGSESLFMVCFGINGLNSDLPSQRNRVFHVLRNLLVLDRASSACGKVFRCSQSALSECKWLHYSNVTLPEPESDPEEEDSLVGPKDE